MRHSINLSLLTRSSRLAVRSFLVIALALPACKSHTVTTGAVDVSEPGDGTPPSMRIIDLWALEAIDGQAVSDSDFGRDRPRLEFNSEGQLTGSSGCNNISSTYTTDGVKLNLGPIIATRMACPGDGENRFLTALKQCTDYKIEGLKLYLLAGGKKKLQFRKID
jgi:heat shock protein HslJ